LTGRKKRGPKGEVGIAVGCFFGSRGGGSEEKEGREAEEKEKLWTDGIGRNGGGGGGRKRPVVRREGRARG